MKLSTHLHVVPRLRMHGAVPPLPHIFMVWCLITAFIFMVWYFVKYKDNFALLIVGKPHVFKQESDLSVFHHLPYLKCPIIKVQ
jgi:hypothetical protein